LGEILAEEPVTLLSFTRLKTEWQQLRGAEINRAKNFDIGT